MEASDVEKTEVLARQVRAQELQTWTRAVRLLEELQRQLDAPGFRIADKTALRGLMRALGREIEELESMERMNGGEGV